MPHPQFGTVGQSKEHLFLNTPRTKALANELEQLNSQINSKGVNSPSENVESLLLNNTTGF